MNFLFTFLFVVIFGGFLLVLRNNQYDFINSKKKKYRRISDFTLLFKNAPFDACITDL